MSKGRGGVDIYRGEDKSAHDAVTAEHGEQHRYTVRWGPLQVRQRRRRRRCSVGDSDGDGSNRGTGGGVVCLEWQRRRDEVVVGRDEMMREMRMLRLVQRVEGAVQLVREMMVMVMMIAMVLVAAVAVNGGGFVTVGGRHSSSRQLRKRLLWLYLVRLLRWWGKLRWGLRQL